MSGKLAGKVLVLIGGSSGLGLSAAQAFIREGAKIVITGRQEAKIDEARKLLGPGAIGLAADAMDPSSSVAAINLATGNFGGFHGLYHVAGGSGRREGDGPLHALTNDGWTYTLNENLTSMFYSNRAAVQQFLKQNSGGTILNMGSVLGFSPSPHYFSTHAYASAKAAIIGLTKSAAAYYAPGGIRFNVVAPALVATPMSQRAQGNDEVMQFISTKQPLDGGRIGEPGDLDGAAVFFMSDDSRFVTGQVLAIDGGWCVSDGQVPLKLPPEQQKAAQPPSVWSQLGQLWTRLKSGK